jgi:ATP-binding cassette subfamily C (CFTR/MRP) protein 4
MSPTQNFLFFFTSLKTSLLQAIMGELPIDKGTIKVEGTLGYTGQEPWVFAGTIRQNVLFGLPYEQQKYKRILNACALAKDMELFQYGDRTLVGDRGVTLSGGQKARLSLARSFLIMILY